MFHQQSARPNRNWWPELRTRFPGNRRSAAGMRRYSGARRRGGPWPQAKRDIFLTN